MSEGFRCLSSSVPDSVATTAVEKLRCDQDWFLLRIELVRFAIILGSMLGMSHGLWVSEQQAHAAHGVFPQVTINTVFAPAAEDMLVISP